MTAPTPYEPPDGHIICRLDQVPNDWEYRFGPEDVWAEKGDRIFIAPAFVEARPARQPDPKWLRTGGTMCISMTWTGDRTGDDDHMYGVTTVGEMRGRTDLGQWEYADTDPQSVGWTPYIDMLWDGSNNNQPIIVRRVS